MLTSAGIILLLIALTGFYVAAEFGAVGVRRSRVRRLSEDGHLLARRLLPFVEDAAQLDRYVAASQIGITLSSLILGAYAQATATVSLAPWVARAFDLTPHRAESWAVVAVLILLTGVQVMLGELIPKSLALQFPTQVALATVLPMQWSLRAYRPVITMLNGAASLILRVLGGGPATHRHLHSPQEIALLIAESRDGGLLEANEQQRLQKALQLGRRTAGDLMVPRERLSMLNVDTPWTDVVRVVAASPFSRLPVYRGTPDNILGAIRVKDLVSRFVSAGPIPLEKLARPLPRLPVTLAADRIIGVFRAKRAHLALVVDADDRVVGLVTIHDVIRELLGGALAARQGGAPKALEA
jgi:CBS domain containing-hemolysin-like protein